MKQSLPERNIIRSGELVESSFGIAAGDEVHILGILRDKLYSNKVAAVVREYCCNAQDSHIEAGCPERPIKVNLPTKLEPTFSVKDYGIGLSEDEVRNLYVMYGKSTKRNTNAQVGMLGLGCKSAFCYTDTFSIVSVKDGIESHYSAYIDETGVGKISLMHCQDAGIEETGVTISIPVKHEATREFEQEAVKILSYFDPPPIFNRPIELKQHKHILTSEKDTEPRWSVTSENDNHDIVIMGNVPYPMRDEDCRLYPNDGHRSYYGTPKVILWVPIGSVDVSASRESLEYTDKTKAFLKKQRVLISQALLKRCTAQIEEQTDYFSAYVYYLGLKSSYGLRNFIPKDWRGIEFRDHVIYKHELKDEVTDTSTIYIASTVKIYRNYRSKQTSPYKLREFSTVDFNSKDKEGVTFIEVDDPKCWTIKCKYFQEQNLEKQVWVVKWPDQKTRDVYYKHFHLEHFPWTPVSTLPKPPRAPRAPRTSLSTGPDTEQLAKYRRSIFTADLQTVPRHVGRTKSNQWIPIQSLPSGPKLYLTLDHFKIVEKFPNRGRGDELSYISARLREMQSAGIIDTEPVIFGVKANVTDKVIDKCPDDWISVHQWMHDTLVEYFKDGKIWRLVKFMEVALKDLDESTKRLLTLLPNLLEDKEGIAFRMLSTYHKRIAEVNKHDLDTLSTLISEFRLEDPTPTASTMKWTHPLDILNRAYSLTPALIEEAMSRPNVSDKWVGRYGSFTYHRNADQERAEKLANYYNLVDRDRKNRVNLRKTTEET